MALALDRPQLERQRGPQRMGGRHHTRSRKLGGLTPCVAAKPHQIGDEQEQPACPGGEFPRGEHELGNVGNGFHGGTDARGTLRVEAPWQGRETLRGEHFAYGGSTQRCSLLLERLTDLVDRIIALAQGYDLLMGAAFLGLLARAGSCGSKEFRQLVLAKGAAQLPKSSG